MIYVKSFTEFLACDILSISGVNYCDHSSASPPPTTATAPGGSTVVVLSQLPCKEVACPDRASRGRWRPSLAGVGGRQCQEKGWVLDHSEDNCTEKGRPSQGQTKQAIETENV